MPEAATLERARRDRRQGKSPSTQAGEFVREEIHHIREGKHGARSTKQAIAIGLSKARKAGIKLPNRPKAGRDAPPPTDGAGLRRNARKRPCGLCVGKEAGPPPIVHCRGRPVWRRIGEAVRSAGPRREKPPRRAHKDAGRKSTKGNILCSRLLPFCL
jgi:hypothetical protein